MLARYDGGEGALSEPEVGIGVPVWGSASNGSARLEVMAAAPPWSEVGDADASIIQAG